jgi:hypothetical protein
MSKIKYTNLFRHFEKLDTFTNMIYKNTYKITRQSYPTSESLVSFDEPRYRQLYKNWGSYWCNGKYY